MTQKSVVKVEGEERFELGQRYEEVGPDLGCLYEGWNALTGHPALVLHPSDRVEWRPSGVWRVILSCHPEPVSVTLEVERTPEAGRTTEMADALVLMTAAVQRVEDNAQANLHLEPEPGAQAGPHGPGRRRAWRAGGGRALSGLAGLVLGLGVRLCVAGEPIHAGSATLGQGVTGERSAGGIAYPMPDKPFRDQVVPPCTGSRAFVELNGGCWAALEQKPPCEPGLEAEYKGKCYLPVLKRDPVPQAAQN